MTEPAAPPTVVLAGASDPLSGHRGDVAIPAGVGGSLGVILVNVAQSMPDDTSHKGMIISLAPGVAVAISALTKLALECYHGWVRGWRLKKLMRDLTHDYQGCSADTYRTTAEREECQQRLRSLAQLETASKHSKFERLMKEHHR